MTPGVFDPTLFVADFVGALDRLERWAGSRPVYPTRSWHSALSEAEFADVRRLVQARCAQLDAAQRQMTYYERLYGTGEARMNGRLLRVFAVESEIVETRGRPRARVI